MNINIHINYITYFVKLQLLQKYFFGTGKNIPVPKRVRLCSCRRILYGSKLCFRGGISALA